MQEAESTATWCVSPTVSDIPSAPSPPSATRRCFALARVLVGIAYIYGEARQENQSTVERAQRSIMEAEDCQELFQVMGFHNRDPQLLK